MNTANPQATPETRADFTLAAALRAMEPLVGLLLREGVTYTRFASAFKATFLEAAPAVLEASSTRVNDSSISTLTGIHRKDVREWRSTGQPKPQTRAFGAVMEVFTRWTSDPAYCDRQGHPLALDRAGGPGTFEALASSVSNDVHPHTLLRELIRLGVARRVEPLEPGSTDKVSLCADAFVPQDGFPELLQLLSANVGDHLAAATHNVGDRGSPMLEQSVYADSLSQNSIDSMHALARQLWSTAFHETVRRATVLSEQDRGQIGADQRLRIGMYFYSGPDQKAPIT